MWRLFELGRDPIKKPMEIINAFVDPIVRIAMAGRQANIDLKERTFLDHLINSTQGSKCSMPVLEASDPRADTKIIRDELLNMLLAARDTVRTRTRHRSTD